jgi:hypothetical protein
MSGPRLRPSRPAVAAALALAASVSAIACRDREPQAPPPLARDAGPARRVIVPAVGDVRPLPPHAIRTDGVGPYKLGAPLDAILAQLPSGPRVALLDLQGVVDVSVIRAEDDGVLVGGESVGSTAAYIAVVRPELARTESGIGVGSTREQVDAALGAPLVDARVARDPRLAVYGALPGARFVLANDRVAAVLLRRRDPDAGGNGRHDSSDACAAGPRREAALVASGLRGQEPHVTPLCLTAAGELAITAGDSLAVVTGEGDRAKRLASAEIRGLRFAAPVRVDAARDELVVVAENGDDLGRVLTVAAYRLDGGKLVRYAEQDVYRIASTSAGWIGARLADIDLLLEVEARPDALVVGGAFVHRSDGLVRDLAPLEPVRLPRRRRPPSTDTAAPAVPHDAGQADATETPDAAP